MNTLRRHFSRSFGPLIAGLAMGLPASFAAADSTPSTRPLGFDSINSSWTLNTRITRLHPMSAWVQMGTQSWSAVEDRVQGAAFSDTHVANNLFYGLDDSTRNFGSLDHLASRPGPDSVNPTSHGEGAMWPIVESEQTRPRRLTEDMTRLAEVDTGSSDGDQVDHPALTVVPLPLAAWSGLTILPAIAAARWARRRRGLC